MTNDVLFEYLESTLQKDKIALEKINQFLAEAPPGYISQDKCRGRTRFRQTIIADGNKSQRKYLCNEDADIIEKLIKKSYYIDLKKELEKEISTLKAFYDEYQPQKKERIFERLSAARKKLILPLFETVEDKVKLWREQEYIPNPIYPEQLCYETDKNEFRRSKSERDISNVLDAHSNELEYRYEPQTYFPASRKYYFPDFVVINLRTGREYYWEHFGGFGLDEYYSDYAKKMQCYMNESTEFKESLIMTFETKGYPLQIKDIKATVNRMIKSI